MSTLREMSDAQDELTKGLVALLVKARNKGLRRKDMFHALTRALEQINMIRKDQEVSIAQRLSKRDRFSL